jgi:hypothetical protein
MHPLPEMARQPCQSWPFRDEWPTINFPTTTMPFILRNPHYQYRRHKEFPDFQKLPQSAERPLVVKTQLEISDRNFFIPQKDTLVGHAATCRLKTTSVYLKVLRSLSQF